MERVEQVLIIGAGLAGLACARTLALHGIAATVVDKGRGPGGRLSTRRIDRPDGGAWRFDHGGQYLSIRDPGFAAVARDLMADGALARWDGHVVKIGRDGAAVESPGERFVGVPGMNALVRALADGLVVNGLAKPVSWGVRALPPERTGGDWHVRDEAGREIGRFDAVLCAAPAPQTADLLATAAPALADEARSARMAACWAVMAAFEAPVPVDWDAAFVAPDAPGGAVLGWVARDGSKPGRDAGETWVLHGNPNWSDANVELSPDDAASAILDAFDALVGRTRAGGLAPAIHVAAHRWRYALPARPLGVGSLWDPDLRLGACGDWCVGARAEAAWVSGTDLAARVLGSDEDGDGRWHGAAEGRIQRP